MDPSRFDADHWERIVETGYEQYLDPLEPQLPDLDDSWLTPHERRIRLERHRQLRARRVAPPAPIQPATPEGERSQIDLGNHEVAGERPGIIEFKPFLPIGEDGVGWHDVEEAPGAVEMDDEASVVEQPGNFAEDPPVPGPRSIPREPREARPTRTR